MADQVLLHHHCCRRRGRRRVLRRPTTRWTRRGLSTAALASALAIATRLASASASALASAATAETMSSTAATAIACTSRRLSVDGMPMCFSRLLSVSSLSRGRPLSASAFATTPASCAAAAFAAPSSYSHLYPSWSGGPLFPPSHSKLSWSSSPPRGTSARIAPLRRLLSDTRRAHSRFSHHSSSSSSSSRLSASLIPSSDEPDFDVIVVGGGHAGCDAASASARSGARTALITQRLDTVGELSCNPSVGGIGKGHLVREIDALGGVMGDVADCAGIHFRVLNRRKGPAVRGPRAQMDRDLYKAAMQNVMFGHDGLAVLEGGVEDLLLDEGDGIETLAPVADNGEDCRVAALASSAANAQHRKARIRGVLVKDASGTKQITARCVVITTGTFLRGVLMIGKDRYSGGRHLRDSERVEPPSVGLAKTLERFHFPLGRLKTGTPPRLDGRTIDWDVLPIQPSEVPAVPFSHLRQFRAEQPPLVSAGTLVNCHKSSTNDETHRLVMEYAHLLPQYDGLDGKGNGPRYCPSIYKKVERFPQRSGHNSFLEPEGLNSHVVYPNGMSGPYPEEIQLRIMRTMPGLANVEIVRPGYDVEYDFVNPQCLTHTLETKAIGGLYLAGQICGTTGYEEAAAQGIVAGANAGRAAASARNGDGPAAPFVVGRDEGYIGVLVDDLVTRGTTEPYRMFTSRAEYRISLRADNADLRLTKKGADFGIVTDEERLAALDAREYLIEDRISKLRDFSLLVTDWATRGNSDAMGGDAVERRGKAGNKKSAEEVLGMPHVTLKAVEDIMADVFEASLRKNSQANAESDSEIAAEAMDIVKGAKDERVVPTFERTPHSVYDTVEASVKYQSYIRRQSKDMESWRKAREARIPPDITYDRSALPTLSNEELEKLNLVRPSTFAEASNISGMTPQSLVYLYHHVLRRNKDRNRRMERQQQFGGGGEEETTTTTTTTEVRAQE